MVHVPLFFALFALQQAALPPSSDARVIVYPIEAKGDLGPLAASLTEEVLLSLESLLGLKVMGHAELNLVLMQIKEQKCQGDQAKDCMKKMLDMAKADEVVTGSLSRMGEHLVGTLSRLQVGTLTHIKSESFLVEDKDQLSHVVRQKARLLFEDRPKVEAAYRFSCGREGGCKLALFPMERFGVDASLASSVSELLSLQLKRTKGLSVISHHEIETIIKYKVEQRICFGDSNITECLQLVRSVVDTDYAVLCALSKLQDTFILHLKLVRLKGEANQQVLEVIRRTLEPYRGAEEGLAKAVEFAAANLLGHKIEGKGSLSIKTSEPIEAKVLLDAKGGYSLPMQGPIDELFAGRHQVAILAKGYERFDQEVYVQPGQLNEMGVKLKALPTPWYKSWWFWTTTAVVVAGAAAGTTAYLMLDAPSTGRADVFVEVER